MLPTLQTKMMTQIVERVANRRIATLALIVYLETESDPSIQSRILILKEMCEEDTRILRAMTHHPFSDNVIC